MRLLRCVLLSLLLLLAACGSGSAPNAPADEAADAGALQPLTMAFSFVPNVQFAPFYVAASKGYYAEAGLDVSFDYNFETDVLQRVATWPESDVAFGHNSGLSVMLARQQGVPVRTIMTHYQQFPVVFFGKENVPLAAPADLRDARIGIPGRFGASYYALLTLLYVSDVTEGELDVQEVGFNQFQLVLEDRIDVASGYAMNEPVRLREQEGAVSVLRVADYFPLVSDGIVTSERFLAEQPEAARAFVQASLRGLRDTLANPDEAFELSLAYIPEADNANAAFERTVLAESLPYWEADMLGFSQPDSWQQSHDFLLDVGLLNEPITVEDAYTNSYIEAE